MSTEPEITQRLGKLALEGFGWQALNRIGRQGFQFGISIVLARLLLPSDYGLVGMTAVFINVAQTVGDLGFGGAIVQRKDVTDEQLHSIFWISLGIGLGLWGLAVLAAPWIASFYEVPAVAPILIASAIGVVLRAPSGVPRALIYKQMQFKYSFFMDWISIFVSGLVSITAALMGLGVWSLVLGGLSASLAVTVIVWRFCRWRPRLVWQPTSLKEMTKFSSHYLGSTLFSSLTKNLDYLIIGKLFTPTELGLYTLAFRLMDLPRTQFGLVIQSVMYPVFVHLQEDDDRTRAILYKICLAVSLLVFPVLIGLMVVAPDFILVVYGSKWLGVAILLQLLVWAGIISAVDLAPFVMNARGKAHWVFWMSVSKTSLLVVVILLGASHGLTTVAMLISVHTLLTTLFFQHWVNRLTGFTYHQYLRSFGPATFASILVGLAAWSVKNALILLELEAWILLVLQITAGGIAFVIALFLWPADDVRQLVIWGQSRIPILENSRLLRRAIRYWGLLTTSRKIWSG